PIGRREVREIILRLRTSGRTVLFSSHILSDAEMLCSRAGIRGQGRSRPAEGAAGWEGVVSGLTTSVAERLRARVRSLTIIADGRYTIELAPETRPEPLIAELAAAGATLVSVTALRTTLEDVFLQHLASEGQAVAEERRRNAS